MPRKVKETGLFNMGFGSPVLPRRRRTRISPPPPPEREERESKQPFKRQEREPKQPFKRREPKQPFKRKTWTWENIPGERRKPHTQAQLEALERLTQEEIGDAIRKGSIPMKPEAKMPKPKRRQMEPEAKMPKRR